MLWAAARRGFRPNIAVRIDSRLTLVTMLDLSGASRHQC
jgi:hypothetical protein